MKKQRKQLPQWVIMVLALIGFLFFIAPALLLPIYIFVASPISIQGQSMSPNFKDNEYYMVNKLAYFAHRNEPQRGDVVTYWSNKKPGFLLIGRVIGLKGERIRIVDGQIFINDKVLVEPYLAPETQTTLTSKSIMKNNEEILLSSQAEYFILGDNREHSSDSRENGPVDLTNIYGKVSFRYWPPH